MKAKVNKNKFKPNISIEVWQTVNLHLPSLPVGALGRGVTTASAQKNRPVLSGHVVSAMLHFVLLTRITVFISSIMKTTVIEEFFDFTPVRFFTLFFHKLYRVFQ
jgi:hypothetical protein